MKKLYLIHLGYFDEELSQQVFESHTNIFLVADDIKQALAEARKLSIVTKYNMHVDGIQEINVINGYKILTEKAPYLTPDKITSYNYDELINFKTD